MRVRRAVLWLGAAGAFGGLLLLANLVTLSPPPGAVGGATTMSATRRSVDALSPAAPPLAPSPPPFVPPLLKTKAERLAFLRQRAIDRGTALAKAAEQVEEQAKEEKEKEEEDADPADPADPIGDARPDDNPGPDDNPRPDAQQDADPDPGPDDNPGPNEAQQDAQQDADPDPGPDDNPGPDEAPQDAHPDHDQDPGPDGNTPDAGQPADPQPQRDGSLFFGGRILNRPAEQAPTPQTQLQAEAQQGLDSANPNPNPKETKPSRNLSPWAYQQMLQAKAKRRPNSNSIPLHDRLNAAVGKVQGVRAKAFAANPNAAAMFRAPGAPGAPAADPMAMVSPAELARMREMARQRVLDRFKNKRELRPEVLERVIDRLVQIYVRRRGQGSRRSASLGQAPLRPAPAILEDGGRLMNLHVPKCGGTTFLENFLKPMFAIYGVRACELYPMAERSFCDNLVVQWTSLPPLGRSAFRFITGHFAWGLHGMAPEVKTTYLTMVRDPVARLKSQYFYRPPPNTTLLQFALPGLTVHRRPRHFCNLQTAQIGGFSTGSLRNLWQGTYFGDLCLGPGQDRHTWEQQRVLSNAIKHLDAMPVVLLLERFAESACVFSAQILGRPEAVCGFPPNNHRRWETSERKAPRDSEANPDILEELERASRLDRKLYKAAEAHLKRMLDRFPICRQATLDNGAYSLPTCNSTEAKAVKTHLARTGFNMAAAEDNLAMRKLGGSLDVNSFEPLDASLSSVQNMPQSNIEKHLKAALTVRKSRDVMILKAAKRLAATSRLHRSDNKGVLFLTNYQGLPKLPPTAGHAYLRLVEEDVYIEAFDNREAIAKHICAELDKWAAVAEVQGFKTEVKGLRMSHYSLPVVCASSVNGKLTAAFAVEFGLRPPEELLRAGAELMRRSPITLFALVHVSARNQQGKIPALWLEWVKTEDEEMEVHVEPAPSYTFGKQFFKAAQKDFNLAAGMPTRPSQLLLLPPVPSPHVSLGGANKLGKSVGVQLFAENLAPDSTTNRMVLLDLSELYREIDSALP